MESVTPVDGVQLTEVGSIDSDIVESTIVKEVISTPISISIPVEDEKIKVEAKDNIDEIGEELGSGGRKRQELTAAIQAAEQLSGTLAEGDDDEDEDD